MTMIVCSRGKGCLVISDRARDPAPVERFEVRWVDTTNRQYIYVSSDRTFHDACIQADFARVEIGGDFVVIDRTQRRIVYDSRLLA